MLNIVYLALQEYIHESCVDGKIYFLFLLINILKIERIHYEVNLSSNMNRVGPCIIFVPVFVTGKG